MGIFDFFKKKTEPEKNAIVPETSKENNDILSMADQLLVEVSVDFPPTNAIRLPIAEITTLGGGLSSLLPSLRTITQTASISGTGLFQLANAGVGDALKAASDGTFWGSLKTVSGSSKMAKFVEAGSLTTTTKTVAAINPALLVMAVSLANNEHKLKDIADMEKQILSFLEHDMEAKVEGSLKTLTTIITEYKFNWDNELYCTSHYKQAGEIREKAEEYIRLYQKEIRTIYNKNPSSFLLNNGSVEETKHNLKKKFGYYKLSLYIYSFASMLEVMLLGNFQSGYIKQVQTAIEERTESYLNQYSQCYKKIETLSENTLESQTIKGLGDACISMGNFLGGKGIIAEWLVDRGNDLEKRRVEYNKKIMHLFMQIEDPGNSLFIHNLDYIRRISNNSTKVFFDKDSVYFVDDGAQN